MNTKLNAPSTCRSTSTAAVSRLRSGWLASSDVTRSVSDVERSGRRSNAISPLSACAFSTSCARSPVLVRLPLCARAMLPIAVDLNVGCAFSQTDEPDVE